MQKLFKLLSRILDTVEPYYQRLLVFLEPALRLIRFRIAQVKHYFLTHPKARKRSIIASCIVGPPLILIIVVWIEIPSKRALRNFQNQVASEVYSADSVLLGRYFLQDRTEVTYDQIAPVVFDALIATEDVRFYEHSGIDYTSMGRVLVKSIFMQDESAGGGSTISQQLAKNLYPRKNYWVLSMLINKSREIITAQRLEDIYTKDQLITFYLNTVPFGDQAFGIEAAAKRFFGVSAKELSAEQAAVLVGMLKATHAYNPRLFPERARTRRNVVLAQMVKYNRMDSIRADSLKKLPLELNYQITTHHEGLAPYFREYLKAQLLEWCQTHYKDDDTPYNFYADGLKIYTTLDSRMQLYAEQAVTRQMEQLQHQFFTHWGKQKPWKGNEKVLQDAIERSDRYQKLKTAGMAEADIIEELQKPVLMRVFNWTGERAVEMSPIDSIQHSLQFLNAGFLALDPHTGQIRAWVGGIDHDFFQYDHVKTTTKRQVGSVFKPIVYAMAIEKGTPPCDLISAEQQTYIDDEGVEWTPKNMQNDYRVRYTMRGALAYSVNTVAVKMIQQAGVSNTVELARRMGITSEMKPVPSVALGSGSISLMEMTAAYACLANDGMPVIPYGIQSITDMKGNVFTDFVPEQPKTRVLRPSTTRLVTQMLRTVVHEGTASRLRWKYGIYNLDVAGKTGTTQANADGWFMCYTPKLAVGSWVGADDPRIHFRTTELGQGSNTALPTTAYFFEQIMQDKTMKDFVQAKFAELPRELSDRLDCDLYELDSVLIHQARGLLHQRDSIMAADTLAELKESFLEYLYRRKVKRLEAQQARDSLEAEEERMEQIGG